MWILNPHIVNPGIVNPYQFKGARRKVRRGRKVIKSIPLINLPPNLLQEIASCKERKWEKRVRKDESRKKRKGKLKKKTGKENRKRKVTVGGNI